MRLIKLTACAAGIALSSGANASGTDLAHKAVFSVCHSAMLNRLSLEDASTLATVGFKPAAKEVEDELSIDGSSPSVIVPTDEGVKLAIIIYPGIQLCTVRFMDDSGRKLFDGVLKKVAKAPKMYIRQPSPTGGPDALSFQTYLQPLSEGYGIRMVFAEPPRGGRPIYSITIGYTKA